MRMRKATYRVFGRCGPPDIYETLYYEEPTDDDHMKLRQMIIDVMHGTGADMHVEMETEFDV